MRLTCLVPLFGLVLACNAKSGGTVPAPKAQGEPFKLSVQPPAPGKVGGQFEAGVTVVPQGGYKVNLEYPTKLQITGPEAASPRGVTLTAKQAAKLTEAEMLFKPSFKISSAGDHTFKGALRFSVCTEKQCEIKNEKVKWVARVSAE